MRPPITIRDARQNNLRGVDLTLPAGRVVVFCGVSGSGKSSLAHDVIHAEGQRRYLELLSSHARRFLARLDRPELGHAEGLRPALAVDQRTASVGASPRSTVGTMSELSAHLRLLLSRLGQPHRDEGRAVLASALSFNMAAGQCPACRGLGVQDRVDPELLVADADRTLRQGALVITTPSGYLVYSQITMESLDLVCQAHGFSVDRPWRELSDDEREVVLYGSDRVKVPLGKHTLESRLRWTGITARPRQEGHYRGIVPVIEGILKVKRNKNALRFARSVTCESCAGARLAPHALAVRFRGRNMADLADMTVDGLDRFLAAADLTPDEAPVGELVIHEVRRRCGLLSRLGVGHLQIGRAAGTLAGGEARRVRLANQVRSGLRGMIQVLDEPTVGLHPLDMARLVGVLRELRDGGSSVLVVEHDRRIISGADWVVDVGPGAGASGGRVTYSGPPAGLLADDAPPGVRASVTRAHLRGERAVVRQASSAPAQGELQLLDVKARNLRGVDVTFRLGALNVVSGVSGSGKSTLVSAVLAPAVAQATGQRGVGEPGAHGALHGADDIKRVVLVDQRPIGRSPRSNPATYTKVHDRIRALLADQPLARQRGHGRGHFSFNVKGGRCEACEGAGVQLVGLHYLADAEVRCGACGGRRFGSEILEVKLNGLSVADILDLPVSSALAQLGQDRVIRRVLAAMERVGLGYLPLGQPATTLSGGEAQRVKLAAELGRGGKGRGLYLLDEPTTGLHPEDVQVLLRALEGLTQQGHTVVVVEHDLDVIRAADHLVDLGPGSGERGGRVMAQGAPDEVAACQGSLTGAALRGEHPEEAADDLRDESPGDEALRDEDPGEIVVTGARTHNLRQVDVRIPRQAITVIAGVSGSGKSSLALDTIAAEAHHRYASSLSSFARRFMRGAARGQVDQVTGLSPVVTVGPEPGRNRRSTLATFTGVHDDLRLIFSRVGAPRLTARHLSFNHHLGACPECEGAGDLARCDVDRLITHPRRSLLDGAMAGTGPGAQYGDPHDRYVAILKAAGARAGLDFGRPWAELSDAARGLAMRGSGEQQYEVTWRYRRGKRTGQHQLTSPWVGFASLIEDEYTRRGQQRRGEAVAALMRQVTCPACDGRRLGPAASAVRIGDLGIGDLVAMTVAQAARAVADLGRGHPAIVEPARRAGHRLEALASLALGHLTLDRGLDSLSRGEARRAQLAGALWLRLCGLTFVLDEPTVGLHPDDAARLLDALRRLRDQGNTLIIVEHDPEIIRAADHIVEFGPGAGEQGGRVIYAGDLSGLLRCEASPTGQQLGSRASSAAPLESQPAEGLRITGAHAHNLRELDLEVPRGALTVVCGVSGAGKSTLLDHVLLPSATLGQPVGCRAVLGLERFGAVHALARRRGRGARSTSATHSGAMAAVQSAFAATAGARELGFKRGAFARGGKAGRCDACKGRGHQAVEMSFLADVRVPCEACAGSGFTADLLRCQVGGLNIAAALGLTVAGAAAHFGVDSTVAARLEPLRRAGLGYLTLGQPTRTLSTGEWQRLQLATLLSVARSDPGDLLVLDEPTTGLHPGDVAALLELLAGLLRQGHTLLVVEHDPQIIQAAHQVIELGPGAGEEGGRIVQPAGAG